MKIIFLEANMFTPIKIISKTYIWNWYFTSLSKVSKILFLNNWLQTLACLAHKSSTCLCHFFPICVQWKKIKEPKLFHYKITNKNKDGNESHKFLINMVQIWNYCKNFSNCKNKLYQWQNISKLSICFTRHMNHDYEHDGGWKYPYQ